MNMFCKQKFPQPIIHIPLPFIQNNTLVVTEKSDVVKIIVVSQVEICQKQDNHETYSTSGLLNHQQDSFQLSDVVQQLLLQPLKLACALL